VLPDVFQSVGIVHDLDVEALVLRYPCLPQIAGSVVLFGVEGWMMQVPGKKVELFTKGLPNSGRGIFQGIDRMIYISLQLPAGTS